jgi:hypothetical protein
VFFIILAAIASVLLYYCHGYKGVVMGVVQYKGMTSKELVLYSSGDNKVSGVSDPMGFDIKLSNGARTGPVPFYRNYNLVLKAKDGGLFDFQGKMALRYYVPSIIGDGVMLATYELSAGDVENAKELSGNSFILNNIQSAKINVPDWIHWKGLFFFDDVDIVSKFGPKADMSVVLTPSDNAK